MYADNLRIEAFQMGRAVNAAMAEKPGEALMSILNPPEPLDPSKIHPMLLPKEIRERLTRANQ